MENSHVSRSLLSNGCIVVHGQVEHSILSPGVIVNEGVIVRDSIIMADAEIGPGTVVDRCIIDKEVRIGAGCQLGYGDDLTPNWLEGRCLNTGITIVGRNAIVPVGTRVERNVLIGTGVSEAAYASRHISSGDTVDPRASAMWT
jgi:glucose-1-phosphate adenylyltransferase